LIVSNSLSTDSFASFISSWIGLLYFIVKDLGKAKNIIMSSQIVINFLVRDGGQSEDLSKIGGIKSAVAVLDVGKLFLLL
jgi:hypothetical protein